MDVVKHLKVHRHEKSLGDNRFLPGRKKKIFFFRHFRNRRYFFATRATSFGMLHPLLPFRVPFLLQPVRLLDLLLGQVLPGFRRKVPTFALRLFARRRPPLFLGPLVQLVRRRLFPGVRPTVRLVVVDGPLHLPRRVLAHAPFRAGLFLGLRPQFGVVLDGDAGTAFFPGSGGFLLPSIVLGFQLAPLQGNSPPTKARLKVRRASRSRAPIRRSSSKIRARQAFIFFSSATKKKVS